MRRRSGYSFRAAYGHLPDVMAATDTPYAPLTDRASAFGFVKWTRLCKANNKQPIYGVELAVSPEPTAKKVTKSHFTFIATDSLLPLHSLVRKATAQFRYEPLLSYEDINNLHPSLMVFPGRQALLSRINTSTLGSRLMVLHSPSTPVEQLHWATEHGLKRIASSDNFYPSPDDREAYEILCGRGATSQSYPMHILSSNELELVAGREALDEAARIATLCTAELRPATLLVPEKPDSLEDMCIQGAIRLGVDLNDPLYAERLNHELELIEEKKFEDYFYIISDLVQHAKKHMLVGPARGSSCGSLVCYLLGITTIDPLPYGLIFERFIDITRTDLPDIDIDFSDQHRHKAFAYLEQKYGKDRVARLGTVALYKPKSSINETAAALGIPKWKVSAFTASIIDRSGGDSRALQAVEDTFKDTQAGQQLLEEHPELNYASYLEGHPRHHSQHAAGVVVTQEAVENYVAIDSRTNATHCDKKDAEELNLLKIDALGLTQLSVIEDCLRSIGKDHDWLVRYPTDDDKAFAVLNERRWAGVFQWNGNALQSLTQQTRMTNFEDMVAITALARPGPLSSGSATKWIDRKNGTETIEYVHPVFEPHLSSSLGIVIYQEQIMSMCRDIGGLSYTEGDSLRKAMSKSLGKEYFDQFGDRFKAGASRYGISKEKLDDLWSDMCAYGAWCLSGDTVLRNPHPNQHNPKKEITLKELYEAGGITPGRQQKTRRMKRQKLFMYDGHGLKPTSNLLVTYSGKKTTFELSTAKGRKIRATAEHKFMLPDGTFARLCDLRVGDFVMGFGTKQLTDRKKKTGTGSGRHNWRQQELEGEPFFNGKRGNRIKILERDKVCACGQPVEEVHHKNMDHKDHRLDNLVGVCRKCHKKHHAEAGVLPKAYQKGWSAEPDEIISIEEYGIEDVYDVSMPAPHHNFLADDLIVHNCFNRSHAVAYGMISYWCCVLKAHHPVEFAAASLTHESDFDKQLKLLREMVAEGIQYTPVDPKHSIDKWTVADGHLVGPLSNIKGLGPKMLQEILHCRQNNMPLSKKAQKLLDNPVTPIDELNPIAKKLGTLYPDGLSSAGIISETMPLISAQCTGRKEEMVVVAKIIDINPRDHNEVGNLAKRNGRKITGPHLFLNLVIEDDTDRLLARINRYDYERVGKPIIDRGDAGAALYAFKGKLLPDFRLIEIGRAKYLGSMKQ